jgi:hypothetical protein
MRVFTPVDPGPVTQPAARSLSSSTSLRRAHERLQRASVAIVCASSLLVFPKLVLVACNPIACAAGWLEQPVSAAAGTAASETDTRPESTVGTVQLVSSVFVFQ